MRTGYRLVFVFCQGKDYSAAAIMAIEDKTFYVHENAKLEQIRYEEDFGLHFEIVEFQEDEEAA